MDSSEKYGVVRLVDQRINEVFIALLELILKKMGDSGSVMASFSPATSDGMPPFYARSQNKAWPSQILKAFLGHSSMVRVR